MHHVKAKAPPANDLEIGEVGLPHLVDPGGLAMEAVRRFYHQLSRADNRVTSLQQAVNRGFRHEVALLIGKPHSQFARADAFEWLALEQG